MDGERDKVASIAVPVLVVALAVLVYLIWLSVSNKPEETANEYQRGTIATRVAKNYEEATVVSKVVGHIQATRTAEANITQCLRKPLSCKSLGLDYRRTYNNCRATALSHLDCASDLTLNPPTVQPLLPARNRGDSLSPGSPYERMHGASNRTTHPQQPNPLGVWLTATARSGR